MKNSKSNFRDLLNLASQLGLSIVVPILVGILFGEKLDLFFQTESLFIMIGIILGLGTACVSVWILIKPFIFYDKDND